MIDNTEVPVNENSSPKQEAGPLLGNNKQADTAQPKPDIRIEPNLEPRDNLSALAKNPKTVDDLMKDPNIKTSLTNAGIDPHQAVLRSNPDTGQMEQYSYTVEDILEIARRGNPNDFEFDKPPVKNDEKMILWLKWRNADHYVYSGFITQAMMTKAIRVAERLGIPIEELSEAQILMSQDLTDEGIQKIIEQREAPDILEIIRKTPGILTEDEIRNLNRQSMAYLRTKKQIDPLFEPRALHVSRQKLPFSIGERFDAHGLAKGDELRILNYLLSHGINPDRPFNTCALRSENETGMAAAVGAAGPYDTGAFIVLGDVDKPIEDKINIVLVNEHYYGAVPLLQEKFPNVIFIKALEMTSRLSQIINSENQEGTVR